MAGCAAAASVDEQANDDVADDIHLYADDDQSHIDASDNSIHFSDNDR